MKISTKMEYFGTDIDSRGHFFWICEGDRLARSKTRFENLPFDPEAASSLETVTRGSVDYFYKKPYSVLRIEGSCIDSRPGAKSVFFIKASLTKDEMTRAILSIPIAKKIIEKMPFHVNLKPADNE